MYRSGSWWGGSLPVVQSIYPGGPGAMATLGYTTDPVRYIESLLSDHDPAIIDSALGTLDDGIVDIVTLTGHVGVTLTGAQATTFANNPYLEDQRVSLASHHMYGSSRLGIAQYASGQSQYRWDYLHGVIDTFGVMRPRPWYSYTLNSLYRTGETDVYGIGLDSSAGATALIGLKQYELVNHLQNVQVTISDKKYNKDANGDGQRDAYKAIPVMVYDYYPFGQLMPGRSLDTVGLCVTSTQYTEVPVYHWMNGGALDPGLGGGVSAYNGASITGLPNGGVTASGTGGGFTYTMSGITVPYATVQLNFAYLSGAATIKVYQGTNVGPTGTQLYSASVGYTSPAASLPIYTGGSTGSPATVTVVVDMPVGTSRTLFSTDSIGYRWVTYSAPLVTLVTRCGDPRDKYEFGFNGKGKENFIAGIANTLDYGFRMYNPRIGRFFSSDPLRVGYPWNSPYAFAENDVIRAVDLDGLERQITIDYQFRGKHIFTSILNVPTGKRIGPNKNKILYIVIDIAQVGIAYMREMEKNSKANQALLEKIRNNYEGEQVHVENPEDIPSSDVAAATKNAEQVGAAEVGDNFFRLQVEVIEEIIVNYNQDYKNFAEKLSPQDVEALKALVAMMNAGLVKKFHVTGHTSDIPTKYNHPNDPPNVNNNIELGNDRAIMGGRYLESELAVPKNKINAEGKGWEINDRRAESASDPINQRTVIKPEYEFIR